MSESKGFQSQVSDAGISPTEQRINEVSRLQGIQRGIWQGIQEAKCNANAGVRKLVAMVQVSDGAMFQTKHAH